MDKQVLSTVDPSFFNGRKVVEVDNGDGGEEDPVWVIRFEGGGEIQSFDKTMSDIPIGIVGKHLSKVILSTAGTSLIFDPGSYPVTVNPMYYAMVDPMFTGGDRAFPQRSEIDVNMPNVPPDPHDEATEAYELERMATQEERDGNTDE